MKKHKVLAAFCALMLFTAVAPLVKSQDMGSQNRMGQDTGMSHTVTFNNKTELPGMTLDKGSYQFRLVGQDGKHRVIQVFNSESKFQGNILAIPDSRITAPSGHDIVMYPQGTSTDIQAVKAWIPGSGHPLVLAYSKSEATKLAKNNNQTVPYTDASGLSDQDNTQKIMQASVNAITPNGSETSWEPTASSDVSPQSDLNRDMSRQSDTGFGERDNVIDRNESIDRSEYGVDSESDLPRTASSLPLIGLLGLLSVGAATLLHLAFRS